MKKILGISAFYHDSAAALIIGGEVVAAAQEERFTREKHTSEFPTRSILFCLEEGGERIRDLDAVVFYEKPLLKFERLLETYYAFAPKGLVSFLKAIPVWLDQKMFLKKQIYDGLKGIGDFDKKELRLLFPEHHLSHAASAFFPSPFEDAAILTLDGVGEWCTASIGKGEGEQVKMLKEMAFPHSIGLLYSAFTYFLGFKVNSGEYKLMGLAPYGDPNSERTERYKRLIEEELVDIHEDGSVWMDQRYFKYATDLKMIDEKKWERLFDLERRKEDDGIQQEHCDLAFAIQAVTEKIVIKSAYEAKRVTGSSHLCLAGGVALNCVANGKLLKEGIFDRLYVQPAAGDAGGAVGAALSVSHIYFGEKRTPKDPDGMKGSYLGPYFSEKEVVRMTKRHKGIAEKYEDTEGLQRKVASLLANGNVVGWFQGRMEFGPRALGNRSILGDPRDPEMQKKLNLKIKYREGFRPFAPSVLAEEADRWFDLEQESPYMLLVGYVKEEWRKALPEGYHELPLWDKLYQERSEIQAVTHTDLSARIQTVHKASNPNYWGLIDRFRELTGYPMLINTSFNLRGEPIVCTPEDAYRCFMSTEMDYLVIDDHLYKKEDQPGHEDPSKWRMAFEKD